jgi:hypothetical protein
MLLSQLIKRAQKTLELYGDGEVYQVGEDGDRFTSFKFYEDYRMENGKRIKTFEVISDYPDSGETFN